MKLLTFFLLKILKWVFLIVVLPVLIYLGLAALFSYWGFYLDTPSWAELKPSTAMTAMLKKSPTAMHVTQFSKIQPHWVPITVCAEQINILNEHITSTFETNAAGHPIEIIDAGYTPNDRFYEAHGNYTGI